MLGGTLLAGGGVSVVGAVLGALIVATIRSGLLILQVGNFWLQLFLGLILLLAVMLDRYRSVYAELRSQGRALMNIVQRLFSQEWSALAAAILVGCVVLSLMSPAFLTEFNLYVMLRSFCVVLVVAFAQMLTLAVGQLNLSIGALGGLVAIAVGGMMEKFGFPIALAVAVGLLIGASCGFVNGALTVRTGINGFIITLATASAFAGLNLGITESIPFYNLPAAFVAFGTARFFALPYLLFPPVIVACCSPYSSPAPCLDGIYWPSAAIPTPPSFPEFRATGSLSSPIRFQGFSPRWARCLRSPNLARRNRRSAPIGSSFRSPRRSSAARR